MQRAIGHPAVGLRYFDRAGRTFSYRSRCLKLVLVAKKNPELLPNRVDCLVDDDRSDPVVLRVSVHHDQNLLLGQDSRIAYDAGSAGGNAEMHPVARDRPEVAAAIVQ